MEPSSIKSVLQSILFVANRPLTAKQLAKHLELEVVAVSETLEELQNEHKDSGIVLLENNGSYQFSTQPANSAKVKDFLNTDLREKLTDATVEVLAIIAYRQPVSKAEIEAIRGVNSQYSLRHLLMRGLIEKVPNPGDGRGFLYQTTTEFLQHLGLTSVKDLPEFEKITGEIKLPETAAIAESAAEPESLEQPAEAIVEISEEVEITEEALPEETPEPEIPEEIKGLEEDPEEEIEDEEDTEDEE